MAIINRAAPGNQMLISEPIEPDVNAFYALMRNFEHKPASVFEEEKEWHFTSSRTSSIFDHSHQLKMVEDKTTKVLDGNKDSFKKIQEATLKNPASSSLSTRKAIKRRRDEETLNPALENAPSDLFASARLEAIPRLKGDFDDDVMQDSNATLLKAPNDLARQKKVLSLKGDSDDEAVDSSIPLQKVFHKRQRKGEAPNQPLQEASNSPFALAERAETSRLTEDLDNEAIEDSITSLQKGSNDLTRQEEVPRLKGDKAVEDASAALRQASKTNRKRRREDEVLTPVLQQASDNRFASTSREEDSNGKAVDSSPPLQKRQRENEALSQPLQQASNRSFALAERRELPHLKEDLNDEAVVGDSSTTSRKGSHDLTRQEESPRLKDLDGEATEDSNTALPKASETNRKRRREDGTLDSALQKASHNRSASTSQEEPSRLEEDLNDEAMEELSTKFRKAIKIKRQKVEEISNSTSQKTSDDLAMQDESSRLEESSDDEVVEDLKSASQQTSQELSKNRLFKVKDSPPTLSQVSAFFGIRAQPISGTQNG